MFWLALVSLGLVTAATVSWNDPDPMARLTELNLPALGQKLLVVMLAGALVLSLLGERFTHILQSTLVWGAVAVLAVIGYSNRTALRDTSTKLLASLSTRSTAAPAHPVETTGSIGKTRSVEIVRGRAGDFPVPAHVNGAQVPMVLDTGASAVVLTYEAARAAGLPLEFLSYSVNIDTANGRTRAASVTLDRLAVGNVIERSVPALIAQPGQLKVSLLGLSFLDRLESWQVRGDTLSMRGYP